MMNEIAVMIPQSVENLQLPDPELVTYYNNENERIFWIEGEIADDLFEYSKQIIRFNQLDKGIPIEERKPIDLFAEFYEKQNNQAMTEEQTRFVSSLIERIWGE